MNAFMDHVRVWPNLGFVSYRAQSQTNAWQSMITEVGDRGSLEAVTQTGVSSSSFAAVPCSPGIRDAATQPSATLAGILQSVKPSPVRRGTDCVIHHRCCMPQRHRSLPATNACEMWKTRCCLSNYEPAPRRRVRPTSRNINPWCSPRLRLTYASAAISQVPPAATAACFMLSVLILLVSSAGWYRIRRYDVWAAGNYCPWTISQRRFMRALLLHWIPTSYHTCVRHPDHVTVMPAPYRPTSCPVLVVCLRIKLTTQERALCAQ